MDVRGRRARLTRRAAAVLLPLAAVGALLCALRLAGFTWWVVESPSMGTAAPVGSLVVDRVAPIDEIAVGDVVTYRPPGADATITHRVIARDGASLRTRGDVNSAQDPWRVDRASIVGRAVAIVPIAGWVLRIGPGLVAGVVAVQVLTLLLPAGVARSAARLMGCSVVAAVVTLQAHPLTAVQTLAAIADADGTTVRVVSTGILPVRLSGAGLAPVDLASGAVGTLHLPRGSTGVAVIAAPRLSAAGWSLLVGVCLLPTAVSLAARLLRRRLA